MFRAELDELESRYADRLEILHVLSREPRHVPSSAAASTARSSRRWLAGDARAATTSTSGSCAGRSSWSRPPATRWSSTASTPEHIHLELFFGYDKSAAPQRGRYQAGDGHVPRSPGREETVDARARRVDPRGGAAGSPATPLRLHGRRLRHLPGEAPRRDRRDGPELRARQADLDAGYVLTCQSHPTSPERHRRLRRLTASERGSRGRARPPGRRRATARRGRPPRGGGRDRGRRDRHDPRARRAGRRGPAGGRPRRRRALPGRRVGRASGGRPA